MPEQREDKMKRMIISAVLIVCVVAGSIFALTYTKRITMRMHALERDIRQARSRGESGERETEQLCDFWEDTYDVLSLIEDLDDIEEIDSSISRLRSMAKDDPDSVGAELDSVCRQLDMLFRHQLPSIYSVL